MGKDSKPQAPSLQPHCNPSLSRQQLAMANRQMKENFDLQHAIYTALLKEHGLYIETSGVLFQSCPLCKTGNLSIALQAKPNSFTYRIRVKCQNAECKLVEGHLM